MATDIRQLLAPLRPGGELLPGWRWEASVFHSGVRLDFAAATPEDGLGRLSFKVVPKNRPGDGKGYLSTRRLRLIYLGGDPLPPVVHRVGRVLGALLARNEGRFAKIEYAEMAAALKPPAPPLSHGGVAEIRIIIRCNESCGFCHTDESAENVVFHLEAFGQALDHLRVQGVDNLVISGGEPTLRADLEDFVRLAAHKGFPSIELQTNAVRLGDGGLAARLKAAGLTKVFVSLHSRDPQVLALMTGYPKALPRTIAGVQAALSAGLRVTINHVLTTTNLAGVEEFPQFLHDAFDGQVKRVVFSVASPNFRAFQNTNWVCPPALVGPPLSEALRRSLALGQEPNVPNLCGLPPCVLAPDVRSLHQDLGERGGEGYHGFPGRVHAPACEGCALRQACTGAWEKTLERFGDGWIAPVL